MRYYILGVRQAHGGDSNQRGVHWQSDEDTVMTSGPLAPIFKPYVVTL